MKKFEDFFHRRRSSSVGVVGVGVGDNDVKFVPLLVDCQSWKTVVRVLPSMLLKMTNKTMKMMMKMDNPKMPSSELIKSKIIRVDSLTMQPPLTSASFSSLLLPTTTTRRPAVDEASSLTSSASFASVFSSISIWSIQIGIG